MCYVQQLFLDVCNWPVFIGSLAVEILARSFIPGVPILPEIDPINLLHAKLELLMQGLPQSEGRL